jgi:hypothetical protein
MALAKMVKLTIIANEIINTQIIVDAFICGLAFIDTHPLE